MYRFNKQIDQLERVGHEHDHGEEMTTIIVHVTYILYTEFK